MAEKSKMDRAFEKRDIFMIMDSEDMDKYLFHQYRYYPVTEEGFDGIGYFKFVMFDETTTRNDLIEAYKESVKFGRGFGINIGIIINVEPAVYRKNNTLIDAFIDDHGLDSPYLIERRGKPQKKWNHKISLTEDEFKNMIDSCKDDRDHFMIQTLYYTGMRIGEFIAMRSYWIDRTDDVMIINIPREDGTFKTKSPAGERLIYITDEKTISIITDWFANNESYGRSDVTAWQRCVAIAKKSGITHRVTPHILRHSAISKWVWDGLLSEETIRKMAGHADIKFTSSYYIHQIKGKIPLDVLKTV